jgi:hypothetical protein
LDLSYDKEYCFEYNVPPKLLKIQLKLLGEVELKKENKKINLSSEDCYYFERIKKHDFLIKQSGGGRYVIQVLGKNGEAIKGVRVKVSLNAHNLRNLEKYEKFLESDEDGRIKLFLPTDVDDFTIDKKYFKVKSMDKYKCLNDDTFINIYENEEFNYPLNDIPNNKDYFKIYLLKKVNDNYENISDKIKIDITDKKLNLSHISLSKLTIGEYQLIIGENKKVFICVKEKKENANDEINEENETKKEYFLPIAVEKMNINYDNNELKIKLNKNNKDINNPHVHIIFTQYHPQLKEYILKPILVIFYL